MAAAMSRGSSSSGSPVISMVSRSAAYCRQALMESVVAGFLGREAGSTPRDSLAIADRLGETLRVFCGHTSRHPVKKRCGDFAEVLEFACGDSFKLWGEHDGSVSPVITSCH
ncbi:hypothetical protein [Nocardiopsis eucommiae]|uniref:hypothetical protein n=1 Tax=Nocardiopsis eucommiae TaxID=2831970 RepID=UPI003D754CC2